MVVTVQMHTFRKGLYTNLVRPIGLSSEGQSFVVLAFLSGACNKQKKSTREVLDQDFSFVNKTNNRQLSIYTNKMDAEREQRFKTCSFLLF